MKSTLDGSALVTTPAALQRPAAQRPAVEQVLWRREFLRSAFAVSALAAVPRLAFGQASAPAAAAKAGTDPLPSWNEGSAKRAILTFVADVTRKGGPRFVNPVDRVATFDNDGTLWCEEPTIEVVYTMARVKGLLAARPELAKKPPYSTILTKGKAALSSLQSEDVLKIFADTHTGMTEDEFSADVRRFFTTEKHPKFGVPFTQVGYLPQIELLHHLRANGFATWISSGGEVSFMRTIAQDMYGVPPEQVIGTYFGSQPEEIEGRLQLRRTDKLVSLNDKEGKPGNIFHQIGRRPILAVGNEKSGGDISMLRFALGHTLPSLAVLIDHDDAQREYSYDEKDVASLVAAKRYGFTVVSMKRDWRRIFAFQTQS
jgi:phosphoserine phosphatase